MRLRVHLRVARGQRAGVAGKVIVNIHVSPRWRSPNANPQGSRIAPREWGRLSGKGKLCRAAPTNASGMEQGREASGCHGVTADSARVRAVPRARLKPSRGARTLRTAPTREWQAFVLLHAASRPREGEKGAPGVKVFTRSKNLMRDVPAESGAA